MLLLVTFNLGIVVGNEDYIQQIDILVRRVTTPHNYNILVTSILNKMMNRCGYGIGRNYAFVTTPPSPRTTNFDRGYVEL